MSDQPPLPSLWRMAATAAHAAATFAASGFQTIPKESRIARLKVCEGCPQRVGDRCTVCGCYLEKKSWLPFEDCPLGKWPV